MWHGSNEACIRRALTIRASRPRKMMRRRGHSSLAVRHSYGRCSLGSCRLRGEMSCAGTRAVDPDTVVLTNHNEYESRYTSLRPVLIHRWQWIRYLLSLRDDAIIHPEERCCKTQYRTFARAPSNQRRLPTIWYRQVNRDPREPERPSVGRRAPQIVDKPEVACRTRHSTR